MGPSYFQMVSSPCVKLLSNSESQLLLLERSLAQTKFNAFSTCYLLIRNDFTPLTVIVYVGVLYHDIVVALLWVHNYAH